MPEPVVLNLFQHPCIQLHPEMNSGEPGYGSIKFFSHYVIPEDFNRGSISAINMRGQGHGFPLTLVLEILDRGIRGNDNTGTVLIFASLYQDKKHRKQVNTNEDEAYKYSILELLDIYGNDGQSLDRTLLLTLGNLGAGVSYSAILARMRIVKSMWNHL